MSRVLCYAAEDIGEPGLWVHVVHFCRDDEAIHGGGTLSAADLSNRKAHEANHNGREMVKILAAFRESRVFLVDRVWKAQSFLFARTLLHPRLNQPMRLVDHLYFVAEHDDHHLAKIWELIQVPD